MVVKEVPPKSKFEGAYVGFIIAIIILLIAVIYLIYLVVSVTTKFIDPRNCRQIKGAFGASPNTRGTVLNVCGTDSISPCTNPAASLNDAVVYCELNSSICNAFSYSSLQGRVDIIDANVGVVDTGGVDTYFRQ